MKAIIAVLLAFASFLPAIAQASDAAQIDKLVAAGLPKLYASNPAAAKLARHAKAILVFPKIINAGFMIGGKHGDGALIEHGYTIGYYGTTSATYGLQAGITKFGYALFFMDDEALSYFKRSKGWEIGAGPTVVVADAAFARSATTTTLRKGVVAFFFDQKGLMAGAGLQGTKITRIFPD